MHSLLIDIGNTFTKAAIYQGNQQVAYNSVINTEVHAVLAPFNTLPNRVFIASVNGYVLQGLVNLLGDRIITLVNHQTPMPIGIAYQTPETLGADRLAAACAINALYPNAPALSITLGTCIIIDFVDDTNTYQGGSISPGLGMRFKALNQYTNALPLVELDSKLPIDLIGTTTQYSILSGVVNGMCAEIDGFIDAYKHRYPLLNVVLSGGNAPYFDGRLKNTIFATQNLVLQGLNSIAQYNTPQG